MGRTQGVVKVAPKGKLANNPEDEKTLQTVYGPFTLRRPSIDLQISIHKHAARNLDGVITVDSLGETVNLWRSTIIVCAQTDDQIKRWQTVEKPAGFPEDFSWATAYDPDFLPDLYRGWAEWVNSFRKPGKPDADQAGGTGGVQDSAVSPANADGVGTEKS